MRSLFNPNMGIKPFCLRRPPGIGNLSLFQIVRQNFAKKSNLCSMFCPIFAVKRRKSSILSLILPFSWYNIPLIVHKLKICAKIATKIFLEPFRSSPVRFSGSTAGTYNFDTRCWVSKLYVPTVLFNRCLQRFFRSMPYRAKVYRLA